MAGLRTLAVLYVLGASALGYGYALQAGQPWAIGVKEIAKAAPPFVGSQIGTVAHAANEHAIKPGWAWTVRASGDAWDWTAKTVRDGWHRVETWIWSPPAPKPPVKLAEEKTAKPAAKPVAEPPALRPSVTPPVKTPTAAAEAPKMELAEPETEPAPLVPAPDAAPPSPAEIGRVLAHLKNSLTTELYDNFELFLYISKASHGPWHQRMFVFNKEAGGNLKLAHSFPVSTGREVLTPSPDGTRMWNTDTPTGYFQLDPDRMYKRYTSFQWKHKMPHAMFFNWENKGRLTGVAIHSAVGVDVALLGDRASAGCVRLHPQNAELLFRMIKKDYRGLTPRFAYDRRTATMSKEGLLMHDKAGNLQFAEGYKVLVLIENKGGDDIIAALF